MHLIRSSALLYRSDIEWCIGPPPALIDETFPTFTLPLDQRVERRRVSRLLVMAFVKKFRQLYRRHGEEKQSVNSHVGHPVLHSRARDQ